jgi:hypothetical protein
MWRQSQTRVSSHYAKRRGAYADHGTSHRMPTDYPAKAIRSRRPPILKVFLISSHRSARRAHIDKTDAGSPPAIAFLDSHAMDYFEPRDVI